MGWDRDWIQNGARLVVSNVELDRIRAFAESELNVGLGVWIEINLPFEDWKGNDSFSCRGLNIPGVLIRMKDGEEYLIGHINKIRGVCDDCTEFGSDAIVAAYQFVWKPNVKLRGE